MMWSSQTKCWKPVFKRFRKYKTIETGLILNCPQCGQFFCDGLPRNNDSDSEFSRSVVFLLIKQYNRQDEDRWDNWNMVEDNDINDDFSKEKNEVDAAFAEVMASDRMNDIDPNSEREDQKDKRKKKKAAKKGRKRIELVMKLVLIAFVLTGAVYFGIMSMNQNQSKIQPTAPDYTAVADYANAHGLDIALVENVLFESTNPTDQAIAGSAIRYWVNIVGLDRNGNLTQVKVEDVSVAASGSQGNITLLRKNVIGLYDKDQVAITVGITVSFCNLNTNYEYNVTQQTVSSDNLALLVNTRTGLSSDFGPSAMYFGMEARAGKALEQMLADAASAGYNMWIASDYRSYSQQEALYNSAVASLGADQQDTAKPGSSEHQTGWATDITWTSAGGGLSTSMKDTAEYQWLMENSYKYGFVLRYPEGLTDVTGYYYEPWHFRYIGVGLAAQYHESGMETLDEFLSIPR